MSGVHVSYYQKCSEQLQVGIDMDTSLRTGESVGSIAYAIDIPRSSVTFRGICSLSFTLQINFL
jgi:mitochondrial import receptor subunit TOM40